MLARIALLILPIVLALTPPASATVVVAMDIEEMTAQATSVVRGVVRESRVVVPEGGGSIWTELGVVVGERFKGERGEGLLRVRIPGGALDGIAQRVAGAPELAVGDEVFLFLWEARDGARPRILGLSQGAFRVVRAPDREPEAVSDRRNLGLVARDDQGRTVHRHDLAREVRIPLTELERRVRSRTGDGGAR